MLYGIRIYWHPRRRDVFDRYATPDLNLILDNIKACIKYNVACETFVTYDRLNEPI